MKTKPFLEEIVQCSWWLFPSLLQMRRFQPWLDKLSFKQCSLIDILDILSVIYWIYYPWYIGYIILDILDILDTLSFYQSSLIDILDILSLIYRINWIHYPFIRTLWLMNLGPAVVAFFEMLIVEVPFNCFRLHEAACL